MASYIANDMRVGWVISHNGKRYSVTRETRAAIAGAPKTALKN